MPAVRAWAPSVPGIVEVFHARFTDHAYPEHAHDNWTLLVVDEGAIRYDLDHHEHGALRPAVTLLPPHVSHTGRSATEHGFRKRVLYIDTEVLDESLVGASVDAPTVDDALLRTRVDQLHRALEIGGAALEAESRLALIGDRIRRHLRAPSTEPAPDRLAADLRDLLDAHTVAGLALRDAAALLHAHPSHLVRSFTRTYGLPPHRYLTGRRIEAARRRLLDGEAPAEVAVAVGFHDQAHLHRHFARLVGTTPGRYARSSPRASSAKNATVRARSAGGPTGHSWISVAPASAKRRTTFSISDSSPATTVSAGPEKPSRSTSGGRGAAGTSTRPRERDRRAQPDPLRGGARRGDQGERIPPVPLPGPRSREPEPFRVLDVCDHGGELAAGHAATLRLGTSPGLGERVRRGVARMRAHTPELSVVLADGSAQDHCSALRAGALDIALVRGPIRVRGLHTEELWRDRLHVVLPADHPDANQDEVPISALADLTLRLPERSADPALHDAVLVACRAAGFAPCLGRPVRAVEDALVEIGLGERTATVVLGCAGSAAGVVARPLDPPVEVPGHLLLARAGGQECLQALVTAFGDAAVPGAGGDDRIDR